jgi:hypothetical protein
MWRPAQDIANRQPVWAAFSELYLDTELSAGDSERIAETLSRSPYAMETLEHILFAEVHPICVTNLLQVAGIWNGFDSNLLQQRILRRQRTRLRWPARLVPLRRTIRAVAGPILTRVSKLRRAHPSSPPTG